MQYDARSHKSSGAHDKTCPEGTRTIAFSVNRVKSLLLCLTVTNKAEGCRPPLCKALLRAGHALLTEIQVTDEL